MQKGFRPRLPPATGRGLGLLGHAPAGFNPIATPSTGQNTGPYPPNSAPQGPAPQIPGHPGMHPPMGGPVAPFMLQQQFSQPPPGFNVQGENMGMGVGSMSTGMNGGINTMSGMGAPLQPNLPIPNTNVPPPNMMMPQQPNSSQGNHGNNNNLSNSHNNQHGNHHSNHHGNHHGNQMIGSTGPVLSTPPPMLNPPPGLQGCPAPPSTMSGNSVHPDRDSQLALVSNLLKGLTNPMVNQTIGNQPINQSMGSNIGNQNMGNIGGNSNSPNSSYNNSMSGTVTNNNSILPPHQQLPPPMIMNNNSNMNLNSNLNSSLNCNLNSNLNPNLGNFSPNTPPPNSGLLAAPKQPLLSLPNNNGPNIGLLGHTPYDLQKKPPHLAVSQGLLSTPSGGNHGNRRGHYGNGISNKDTRSYHGNQERGRSLEKTPPMGRNKNNSLDNFEPRNSYELRSFSETRSMTSSSFHRDSLATPPFASLATSVSSSASTTSQDHLSVSDEGQEEYDPAEPTGELAKMEENLMVGANTLSDHVLNNRHSNSSSTILRNTVLPSRGNLKRQRSPSPSSIQVTLHGKGRHVQENGPSSVKREREMSPRGMFQENFLDKPNYCHACAFDCVDIKGFEQHMSSPMHQGRMQEMINMHMRKTDQQLARMKAEEHLRKIEGKAKEDYCRICDKRFPGTFVQHRRTQEHRRKERLTKRGCKLCDTGSYQQYPDYVKHIDSESHKKKKEELRKQGSQLGDTDKSSSVDEDRESFADADSIQDADSAADVDSFPDDLEELVTVDATGIYNDEEHEGTDDEDGLKKPKENIVVTMTTVTTNGTSSQVMQHPSNEPPMLVANEISNMNDASDKFPNNVLTSLQIPQGQEYVIPITGFYCKLCHKFFTKESTATVTHCLSPSHHMKYQKFLELRKQKENGRLDNVSGADDAIKSNSTATGEKKTSSQKDLRVQLVDIKDILETNNNNKNRTNALYGKVEDVNGAVKMAGSQGTQGVNNNNQSLQVRKRVAFNHKNRIIIIRKQVDDDNETEVEMDSCHDNHHDNNPCHHQGEEGNNNNDSIAIATTNGQVVSRTNGVLDSHTECQQIS